MKPFLIRAGAFFSTTRGRAAMVIALLALAAVAGGADGGTGP